MNLWKIDPQNLVRKRPTTVNIQHWNAASGLSELLDFISTHTSTKLEYVWTRACFIYLFLTSAKAVHVIYWRFLTQQLLGSFAQHITWSFSVLKQIYPSSWIWNTPLSFTYLMFELYQVYCHVSSYRRSLRGRHNHNLLSEVP